MNVIEKSLFVTATSLLFYLIFSKLTPQLRFPSTLPSRSLTISPVSCRWRDLVVAPFISPSCLTAPSVFPSYHPAITHFYISSIVISKTNTLSTSLSIPHSFVFYRDRAVTTREYLRISTFLLHRADCSWLIPISTLFPRFSPSLSLLPFSPSFAIHIPLCHPHLAVRL